MQWNVREEALIEEWSYLCNATLCLNESLSLSNMTPWSMKKKAERERLFHPLTSEERRLWNEKRSYQRRERREKRRETAEEERARERGYSISYWECVWEGSPLTEKYRGYSYNPEKAQRNGGLWRETTRLWRLLSISYFLKWERREEKFYSQSEQRSLLRSWLSEGKAM